MMGGQFDQSVGVGYPDQTMSNPEMDFAIQQLVEQYGVTPEQAMQFIMAQAPQSPSLTPPGTLEINPPQLSPQDYAMLAQQFGLDHTGVGADPAYDSEYDIATLLGGGMGYES